MSTHADDEVLTKLKAECAAVPQRRVPGAGRDV